MRAATGWLTSSAGINSMSVTIRLGPTVIGSRHLRDGLRMLDRNSVAWRVGLNRSNQESLFEIFSTCPLFPQEPRERQRQRTKQRPAQKLPRLHGRSGKRFVQECATHRQKCYREGNYQTLKK